MASHIRDRIKFARRQAGFTQEKLGELIGVSKSAISMWETSNPAKYTHPTLDHLPALAKFTKVKIDWLMDDGNNVQDVRGSSTTNRRHSSQSGLSARGLEIGLLSDTLEPIEQDELLAYLKFASRLKRRA